ncbi:TetR/AcrR family transcriptional regulator [Sinosporangium siamense]|uniref:HTH tetR-type domain-containing protein n=1 Tax=Sinosporangium siamense TaxID=1367973 RepID=A0A919V4J5_9ACTN|nr:TetR/AcrR family transcriptional regulator [Sinosporangium siamense]GII90573.1 hypothetical protein Ssi02_08040 [Sinosporangium siamense]
MSGTADNAADQVGRPEDGESSGTSRKARGVRRGRKESAAKQNRAATEAALREAALRLLERDGVLAGLNLQEVADEAGVNRGLIHHYFGSRRALLRAALEARKDAGAEVFARMRTREVPDKELWGFRVNVRNPTYARVLMLLALDGDEDFKPMAYFEDRLADLEREQGESGLDLAAVLVMWDSFMYGYFVMRTAFARQLGVEPAELDARVMETFARLTGRTG